jgi:hypothetical protein
MMVITTEDRIYLLIGYKDMRLLAKFPDKSWKKQELKNSFILLFTVKNCHLSSIKSEVICAILISQVQGLLWDITIALL